MRATPQNYLARLILFMRLFIVSFRFSTVNLPTSCSCALNTYVCPVMNTRELASICRLHLLLVLVVDVSDGNGDVQQHSRGT